MVQSNKNIVQQELQDELWHILTSDPKYRDEINHLLEIGTCIWQRGWAEANAGNVSLRLSPPHSPALTYILKTICQQSTPNKAMEPDDLQWFLVSATGSRYREYKALGFANFVLVGTEESSLLPLCANFTIPIHTEEDNGSRQIVFPAVRKPTSEWITHENVHLWLQKYRPKDKVIFHSHITDWIVLSHYPEYKSALDEMFRKMRIWLPELEIYLPKGFAVTELAPTGSARLAEVTLKCLPKTSVVIWEGHGIVITAENFTQAFDRMEVMAKAAEVYIKLTSKGFT